MLTPPIPARPQPLTKDPLPTRIPTYREASTFSVTCLVRRREDDAGSYRLETGGVSGFQCYVVASAVSDLSLLLFGETVRSFPPGPSLLWRAPVLFDHTGSCSEHQKLF